MAPKSRRETLDVKVQADGQKELTVPVTMTVKHKDRIEISPRGTVTFNRRDTLKLKNEGAPISKEIVITAGAEDVQFEITNVELVDLPDGLFQADISEVSAGSEYKVILSLTEFVAQRYVRGKIRIHTSDPGSPTKELRVFARFDAGTRTAARRGR
jgi:hypothetical protein